MSNKTGWERERRVHFDDIVNDYDKIRPSYPNELFDDIVNYCSQSSGKNAVEIGAGTGKATTPFLNEGFNVTAVEISENMSIFLRKRFAENDKFNVVTSTFEETLLENDKFDLIYAASAFHWVDAKIGCPKAFNLLKKGGAIALFRYNIIAKNGDDVFEQVQRAYKKHYYSFYTENSKPIKKTKEDFLKSSEVFVSFRFEDLKDYGFCDVTMKFYDAQRICNADEYITLLDTMSDHRALPEENRISLYKEIKQIILDNGNAYKDDIIFQLYMGRK